MDKKPGLFRCNKADSDEAPWCFPECPHHLPHRGEFYGCVDPTTCSNGAGKEIAVHCERIQIGE